VTVPILATLLYHALRREELCKLSVKDSSMNGGGVAQFKSIRQGEKTRYVPLNTRRPAGP